MSGLLCTAVDRQTPQRFFVFFPKSSRFDDRPAGCLLPFRFVEDSDVAEAVRLMRVATQNAATDPRTGTIDMDMIATGQGASDR